MEFRNNDTSSLLGYRFGTEVINTQTQALLEVQNVIDLTNKVMKKDNAPIIGGIGPTQSQVAMTLAPVFQYLEAPLVSHSAGSSVLSSEKHFPTFLRLITSAEVAVIPIVDFICKYNISNVVVITEAITAVSAAFEERRLQTCQFEWNGVLTLSSFHQNDIADVVSRIISLNSRTIVDFLTRTPGRAFFNEVLRQGAYKKGYMFLSWSSGNLREYIDLALQEGLVQDVNLMRGMIGISGFVNTTSPEYKQLQDNYTQYRFRQSNPELYNAYIDGNSAAIFDIVTLFQKTLERMVGKGMSVTPANMLQEIFFTTFVGITGPVRFFKNGDLVSDIAFYYSNVSENTSKEKMTHSVEVKLALVMNYEIDQATSSLKGYSAVYHGLLWSNGQFSDKRELSENNTDPSTNPKIPSTFQCVSSGCEHGTCISNNVCTCYDGWTGASCDDKAYIFWGSVTGYTISILVVIGLVFTTVILILLTIHRKNPAVKRTSYLFTLLTGVGCMLAMSSTVLWLGEPSETTCTLRIWLVPLSWAICYGSILVKLYRINCIFNTKRASLRLQLTDKDLIAFTLKIIAIDILISFVYTLVDRPKPVTEQMDSSIEGISCESDSKIVEQFFLASLLIFNALILVISTYYAYRIRHVDHKFNEARPMAQATYLTFFLGIILLLALFIFNPKIALEYTIICFSLIAISYGLVFIMISPKLYKVYYGKEDGTSLINIIKMSE
eukprot:Nk52_evm88s745 gene=Nk52_evmTU88s745